MKTFKDLVFKEHTYAPRFDSRASLDFSNKYGVSVITGKSAYSSEDKPYEVAVMYEGGITYDTGITEDVIGHQTEDEVTEIMKRVQLLK